MKTYKYRAVPSAALATYEDNGMQVQFDTELFNGVLTIDAPDEETADKIRMTFTDIRMWEKVDK
jgi:hypothetical protein